MAPKPVDESIQVVWHDPTAYDPLKHGPPYLPGATYEPVKLSSEQKTEIRRRAKVASIIAPEIPGTQLSPLPNLLASLQAAAMLHQMHHWTCMGPTFFADHKLFERIYTESLELIDQLAEKMVGKGLVITAGDQANSIGAHIGLFCADSHDMVARSLKAEYVCLETVHHCLGDLEDAQRLSHGLSKLLEDIADKHESFTYLLHQREANPYDYDRS